MLAKVTEGLFRNFNLAVTFVISKKKIAEWH